MELYCSLSSLGLLSYWWLGKLWISSTQKCRIFSRKWISLDNNLSDSTLWPMVFSKCYLAKCSIYIWWLILIFPNCKKKRKRMSIAYSYTSVTYSFMWKELWLAIILGGGDTSSDRAKKILEFRVEPSEFSIIGSMAKMRKVHEASIIKLDFKTMILCKWL